MTHLQRPLRYYTCHGGRIFAVVLFGSKSEPPRNECTRSIAGDNLQAFLRFLVKKMPWVTGQSESGRIPSRSVEFDADNFLEILMAYFDSLIYLSEF